MTRDFNLHSKADILQQLKAELNKSRVEDLLIFTVSEWLEDSRKISEQITKLFYSDKVVVRSSSYAEDGDLSSQAGFFHSELDVPTSDEVMVSDAIERVISSYEKTEGAMQDSQVLIQRQTENIRMSGVVFTRQIETNAPYYVINYDDETGRTDTVTGGQRGKVTYISHFADLSNDLKWHTLISAVKEIESLFQGYVLDIEFALTNEGEVVIFQVRPLAANAEIDIPDNIFVNNLIEDMVKKFRRFTRRVPHLAGKRSIMGDMPDWNPSEIIGSRPNTLDYTVYSFIVTDEVWHDARTSLGYYDVYPAELMISFAKKPYIDVRASFNSLTPADISFELRDKLVDFYLDKLEKNPAYQDKVEFEVLWTCSDFNTEKTIKELSTAGFAEDEIDTIKESLKKLTNNILENFEFITKQDLKQIEFLKERRKRIMQFYLEQERTPWNAFSTAFNILQNCKKYGTFPFSRQARLAFIAKSLLMSLRDKSVFKEEFYDEFLNSIRTVASDFSEEFDLMQGKQFDRNEFIEKYGHLRAGTYDITAPRYDKSVHLFAEGKNYADVRKKECDFYLEKGILESITKLMEEYGISGKGETLIKFIKSAIEDREYSKFEFTRSLSDALELIADAGEMLGFTRDQLCHADLSTIMKFKNPEHGDFEYAGKIIGQSIARHRDERKWFDAVILPPLLVSEKDFYIVEPYKAIPNFITSKFVEAKLIPFDKVKNSDGNILTGNIVLLENADPGYDWIFTKKPAGIITKYGGVASHMSIRCAEFGIPAAIGCGDILYDRLKKVDKVRLDCGRKDIKCITQFR